MTHELTTNPVKLRIVDVKSGEWLQSLIFIGSVPDDIERELHKIEKDYNHGKSIRSSSKLKKFYGSNWQDALGIVKQDKNSKTGGVDKLHKEFESIVNSIPLPDGDDGIKGGDDDTQDVDTNSPVVSSGSKKKEIEFDISEMDILSIGPDDIVADDITTNTTNTNTNANTNDNNNLNSDKTIENTPDVEVDSNTEQDKTTTKPINMDIGEITITEEDLLNTHQLDNLFDEREKTLKIEKTGSIKFIYDVPVYPADNILEFKYKIYAATGIPIYRQHLWFKYKSKSYPCSYNISIAKHNIPVDIETLIAFYSSEKKMDEIEGIPVDISQYNNKDLLHVDANDAFNLIYTNHKNYGITEYFVADLDSFIDTAIYNKLSKDKYQLEVIYYGFILLYFPMITYSVFIDYLKNEKAMADIYPDLKPNRAALYKQYEMEQLITNEAYEAYNHPSKTISKKLFSSITSTVVSIDNYKQDIELLLVLRNIFDLIELNDTITYCKASILHENQNIILKKSYMNEQEPKDLLSMNSLLVKIKTNSDTNENMRLILFKNGNYIVKTEWREENHMTFDKIIKQISNRVNPIIKFINSASNKTKHYAVDIPELSKTNTIFTETGIVFYYDDDTTEARYNVFKQVAEDFRRAEIIGTKESTGDTGQEYFFHKGMYKFDSSRIEKTVALDNYYTYLSNGIIKQKWETVFDRTRAFQIMNVSSKLRISISGIKNDIEMEFFYIYLTGLLSIYEKNAFRIKSTVGETVHNKSTKALKNLKLQDPVLYDFKKIYKSNVIYSKICQKPYQPLLLSDDEFKQLPKDKKSKAVHYWNFTKQKPVWYSCPNPRFPYIKFIIKQHPKDFCIPCCKKIAMNENVNIKKQDVHNTCMKDHIFTGEKISLTKGSHYIATYGKDIEVGRLSRLPEHTLEPLFFDTYSPEGGIDQECISVSGYYLFGIDQNLPTVQNIGFMYCLLHALGKGVDEFLVDCSNRIKKQPDKFRVLLDGNIGMYFTNYKILADTLVMLNTDNMLAGYETLPWNNLFMSIGYYYYGINTILFDDQHKERIELQLPSGLKTADEMFPDSHKNLVVLRKKAKFYPIYLLNTEIFKRTGIVETKLFLNESGLITIIRAVIRRYFETSEYEKIKSTIDLSIVKDFISEHMKTFSIVGYFINYANLCYAVLVKNLTTKKTCFLPIHASHYSLETGVELIFTPYDDTYASGFEDLQKLFTAYNKWVVGVSKNADVGDLTIYPLLRVKNWISLRNSSELVIGFTNTTGNVFYYCKAMTVKKAKDYSPVPVQTILYNPININKIIYNIKSGKRKLEKNPALDAKLQKSMYGYYLYNLVLLQFITIFGKQRNIPMRKKILITLAKTNFEKNLDNIKDLIKLLDVEDANKLKNIIARYITVHHDKAQMSDDIHTTYFDFDRVGLEKLKTSEYKKVLHELHRLSKIFVKIGDIDKQKDFHFPNMLLSCGQLGKKDSIDYCSGSKFIIKKDKLDEILSILAYDIINPAKWKWLFNSIFIEKSVDFFKFIRRPNEHISVEFV
jgi:hypothetical protein